MFPDMAHDLPGPRRAEIVEEIARNAARAHEQQPEPVVGRQVEHESPPAPTRRRSLDADS